MTMFVIDMHAPGVEVRPLVQATGEAEFNEVYITDVRIPDAERLGDVGEGWGVSLTTLMNERVSIGGQVAPAVARASSRVAVERVRSSAPSAATRSRATQLARLWIEAEVQPAHEHARVSRPASKGTPGPGGIRRQARDGRPQPADHELRRWTSWARRRCSIRPATRWTRPDDRDGPVQPAEGVPSRAGQLDRGRHDEHHEEHPRRAGPRACPANPGSTRTVPGAKCLGARSRLGGGFGSLGFPEFDGKCPFGVICPNGGRGPDLQVRGQDADLDRDVHHRADGAAAVCAFALVFSAARGRGRRDAPQRPLPPCPRSSTTSAAPTSTTIPPNMPAFTLPTDDGLKLVQAHNQAELDIVSSQGAIRPAQRDAKGARSAFRKGAASTPQAECARTQDRAAARRIT